MCEIGVAHQVPDWSDWISKGWEVYLYTRTGSLFRVVVEEGEVKVYRAESTLDKGYLVVVGKTWEALRMNEQWELRVYWPNGNIALHTSYVVRAYTPHL